VPICKIFYQSGFHDFYTIKPFWVGDFGAKYKLFFYSFGGARHHLISDASAQGKQQFLARMLRVSISS
jgi:hypothetical protein